MHLPTPEQIQDLSAAAVALLKSLIAIPAFSREEDRSADALEQFLTQKNIPTHRFGNNVWAQNRYFDPLKPTVLLLSHHDTVRPNTGYTRDPFEATLEAGKLYGLGSNDAGGSLVSLLAVFCWFFSLEALPYNLVLAAAAEEEVSGAGGIEALLPNLPGIDCAIVGEPTQMQLAVAEKGLLVLDCHTSGRAGHAAREEGENAIYAALPDIEWFRTFRFPRVSPWLGAVKMNVTVVETANKAHNVVPDQCRFVVDVRLTEAYPMEEILTLIRRHVGCTVQPRSMRLQATAIPLEHPLTRAGLALGRQPYGSPTLSDKALLPFPALKMGPGDSARSHTADEFIFAEEILDAIGLYIRLLLTLKF